MCRPSCCCCSSAPLLPTACRCRPTRCRSVIAAAGRTLMRGVLHPSSLLYALQVQYSIPYKGTVLSRRQYTTDTLQGSRSPWPTARGPWGMWGACGQSVWLHSPRSICGQPRQRAPPGMHLPCVSSACTPLPVCLALFMLMGYALVTLARLHLHLHPRLRPLGSGHGRGVAGRVVHCHTRGAGAADHARTGAVLGGR